MYFNVKSFRFASLIVDGTLIITEDYDSVKIEAHNIFIRSGKIVSGRDGFPTS